MLKFKFTKAEQPIREEFQRRLTRWHWRSAGMSKGPNYCEFKLIPIADCEYERSEEREDWYPQTYDNVITFAWDPVERGYFVSMQSDLAVNETMKYLKELGYEPRPITD